jgi:hypothetical protein
MCGTRRPPDTLPAMKRTGIEFDADVLAGPPPNIVGAR